MKDPILDLPMTKTNDADAATIRGYLKALLVELFKQGEGFGGKRPFGSSGWEYDLYQPLVKAGLVSGNVDEDGYLERCDTRVAKAIIVEAVGRL